MKAKDLMTRDPKTCEPDHNLACALRIMADEDCGIVPVTRGNGAPSVVTVVTDRDAALYLGSLDLRPSGVKVEEVMTTTLIVCGAEADEREVRRKMEDAQVRRILVVEQDVLLGVVSTADLARAPRDEKTEEEVGRVVVKISEEGPGRLRA
jgi:CBS domain-containing protein